MIVRTSFKNKDSQTSLKVQWLRLDLPLQGLHVRSLIQDLKPKSWPKPQNIGGKKQKQYCTKFNKDLKKKKDSWKAYPMLGVVQELGLPWWLRR